MAGRLEDRVALVTGAGSGIGRASARALSREGARVAVADIDVDAGRETAAEIRDDGGEAFFLRTDVSSAADVAALVDKVVAEWGRLDCAHNNAGISESPSSTVDTSEETWDRILAVNLKGVWLCMKHEIPRMREAGGGVIVNTSSVVGLSGFEHQPAYVASKHGIIGITRTAALEYASANIRVNAVCPGAIRTPALERFLSIDPAIEQMVIRRHPLGRLGLPEDIAEAVVWLFSDAASFVTGHALVVDGGALGR